MSSGEFVHLHLHTQYSLLEGAIHVDQLFDRVKELGMKSVAMTDSHNLFGAIDFYLSAKKAGIKPIIGCEIHYAPQGRNSVLQTNNQQPGPKLHHLVLLCKNYAGYQNLCKMVTRSYQDIPPAVKGQPALAQKALIDRDLLSEFGDGLIVLSGCIKGEIPYRLAVGEEAAALESIHWFQKRFGEDFYFELQETGLPEQDQANDAMFRLGEKLGIACVATVDCHYLHSKDGDAHEVLQCIEHGKNLDFDRPKSLVPSEYYLKSATEMRERFERFPGTCDNTLKIAEKCDLQFRFKDEKGRAIYHLPNFRPEGVGKGQEFDLLGYFREQSRQGLQERFAQPSFEPLVSAPDWAEKKKIYEERLESELGMIERTGFAGYFLIVADFIIWAKTQGIPVGPGRGSGAGSLVAYSLKITDIDPIEFNLLFERFINPERISMPDFDIDFCQDRRGEVIDYVARKYGRENVCQIITFGKLQAKAVLKDVGRVFGMSFAETNQLTNLVPKQLDITLDKAIEMEPLLRQRMEQDPKVGQVVGYARKLEGLYRSAGMHAAGVIITEEPVVNYSPLFVGREGAVVTQFDKDFAEKIGLVKFDFLGLKTLTVIDNAIKLIHASAEPGSVAESFALERMNYKDAKVFELVCSGDTDGIFQLESDGMKDLCLRILPNSLDDITAINALYRPGPLGSGMVDDFIDRKHGRKPIVYDTDSLAPILKETYGVILYQEQVMQIARELAGYSLGQADQLRRAMGKKIAEEMAQHKGIFVEGAVKKGLAQAKAESIFDLMAKFAEYGFNKSHSAAYGVLTYQTAYLKTYYPAEFMAALMTTEMENTDNITRYIADAREHGIPVLAPDVNLSQKKFSVEVLGADHPAYPKAKLKSGEKIRAIRFGLEAIKGVGGIAVDVIIESRTEKPFTNVLDFCRRVSTRKANKKVLESLTLAGAFDAIAEVNRASLFASLESLLSHAGDEQEERELGQSSLFDSFSSDEIKMVTPASAVFKQEEDFPLSKRLQLEKQVVGFYVSGHPMDGWQRICEDWLGWSTERLKRANDEKMAAAAKSAQAAGAQQQQGGWGGGEGGGGYRRPQRPEIRIGGLLTDYREVTTKKGRKMGIAQLEDIKGRVEVVFFPDPYEDCQENLKRAVAETEVVVLTADIEFTEEGPKLQGKQIEWASEAHKNRVQQVVLKLDPSLITPDQLRELKRSLFQFRGKCPVRIDFIDPAFKTRLDLPKTVGVAGTPQMVTAINKVFGTEVVSLQ